MTALMSVVPERRSTSSARSKPATSRKFVNPLDLIVITTSVVRPVLVTVAVLAASVASTSRANVDPGTNPTGSVLNTVDLTSIRALAPEAAR